MKTKKRPDPRGPGLFGVRSENLELELVREADGGEVGSVVFDIGVIKVRLEVAQFVDVGQVFEDHVLVDHVHFPSGGVFVEGRVGVFVGGAADIGQGQLVGQLFNETDVGQLEAEGPAGVVDAGEGVVSDVESAHAANIGGDAPAFSQLRELIVVVFVVGGAGEVGEEQVWG